MNMCASRYHLNSIYSNRKPVAAPWLIARSPSSIGSKNDLVTYSPVSEKYADGKGMTLAQLCGATTSDKTAEHLILASYGGRLR